MYKKTVLTGLVLAFLLSSVLGALFVTPVRAAETWTVDDDGPADFSTIQDAINAAGDGDTIQVASGIYYEHVVVDKSLTLVGENSNTTIIDGSGTEIVVRITASNVEIRGFTIRDGMKGEGYFFGIWVYRLGGTIRGTTISGNIISNNYVGIELFSSDDSIISGNTIRDNQYGIDLHVSSGNIVSDNTVSSNWLYGIYLSNSGNNDIVDNTISCNNRTFKTCGVYIGTSSGNNILYHNNFVNNTIQAYDNGINVWDNGYPSGGNYWSDYLGEDEKSGPNQNQPGRDGMGDTPYFIDDDSQDRYPLMNPWLPIFPIAFFIHLPEFPVVGETITFDASASYDPNGFITSYEWDFGDGNATTVADPVITYVYTAASTYAVSLTVTDNHGFTGSITRSVTIEKVNSTVTVSVDSTTVVIGSNVTINGSIAPTKVGVNVTISYKPSGGTWITLATVKTDFEGQYIYEWKTTDEGVYEIKASWLGDENTLPAESDIKTVIVTPPDFTPPITTVSLSGVEGNNGWFTSNVTVTLSATDDISGVDKTEYSFDNVTWTTYTMSFIITNEGTTVIYYNSTDKAGNVETTKIETIKIDKTVPSGYIDINSDDAYATSTLVILTLSAIDATSGVYQVRYSNDGVWDTEPWEVSSLSKVWILTFGDGTKTVYYQIKDKAGLVSDTYSDTIILDTTPPTGSVAINDGVTYANTISVTLTLSAIDATSSVAEMRFSHDNIKWTPWEAYSTSKAWTLTTVDGTKAVFVQFMDSAGLISASYQDIILLDATKPTAKAGTDQKVSVGTAVTFDAGASTDNVGMVSYEWDFGDGTTGTGITATHTYTRSGTYTVTLTVKDAAGNIDTHSVTIEVLPTEAFPLWILAAAAAVVIGMAVAVIILWRRRKK